MSRFRLLSLGLVVLCACSSQAASVPPASPSATIDPSPLASPSPVDCANQVFERLTPAQRVGQLIFMGLPGDQLGPAERTAIMTQAVGSVWYAGFSVAPASTVAGVSARVQALAPGSTAGVGFLIGANQEGGQIDQFHGPGFNPIPSALQQGTEDPAVLTGQAATWATQLMSAGINLNLAPVMDTVPPGTDRSNAPIGALQREFGHDPSTVASHGIAFLTGMHESGVLVTLKHFPGLGRVVGNTDFTASVVDSSTTSTDPYLVPFQQAIASGADLVMVSTATYTKIDPQHLAVFSPAIIGLLRDQLHFGGVVVSDDLGAATAVASIPAGTRAVDFIAAGGDLVTVKYASLVAPMTAAILDRATNDPGFSAQVDASVVRVLEVKAHAGLVTCS